MIYPAPTIFTMSKDDDLTNEKLKEYIDLHSARIPRYIYFSDMYKGNHDILKQQSKQLNKPDNRLVVNYAKYIVDTLNGYFVGNPIRTNHPDKHVADKMKVIAKRNSQNDNNSELAKMCSIYGHAYEFMYQDEDANTRVTYIDPKCAFIIYDDTISQNPLYGVRVMSDKKGKKYGTIYTSSYVVDFSTNDKGEIVIDSEQHEHFYGDVSLIEYVENEERQSAFENVISLINAYNKALSEKANDVDYFADAYLSILGVELDEETIKNIRYNRIINLKDGESKNIVVQFLDKPNADTTQENLINRLEEQIFSKAMVSNISDENFGASSGVALEYKLQSMKNIALMKERKFVNSMIKRFKMMFNIPTNFGVDKESYLDIDYVFKFNTPRNIVDEANAANVLSGLTSKRTQLSMLSVVDNVQDELDEIEAEKDKEAQQANTFATDMNMPFGVTLDVEEE